MMLENNAANYSVQVEIIRKTFEEIVINKSYDLVFASMCPAMKNWDKAYQLYLTKGYQTDPDEHPPFYAEKLRSWIQDNV